MDSKLELVLVPVSDVDQALDFYTRCCGFELLVDTAVGDAMRIVQVTPPGSACSVGFGTGVLDGVPPGSYRGMHLVVTDIVAAHAELSQRGVDVDDVRHMAGGRWQPGPHPDRGDYLSFSGFRDPDGNEWVLQERGPLRPLDRA